MINSAEGSFSLTSPLTKTYNKIEPSKLYSQGSMAEFTEISSYDPTEVIYFGDNISTDLKIPNSQAGWKTVGIVRELEYELEAITSYDYTSGLCRVMRYDMLLRECEKLNILEVNELAENMRVDRNKFQQAFLRDIHKRPFGSAFRTYETRSLFAYLLGHHCDLYTTAVSNLLEYPLHATFHSRRNFYTHEPNIWQKYAQILSRDWLFSTLDDK